MDGDICGGTERFRYSRPRAMGKNLIRGFEFKQNRLGPLLCDNENVLREKMPSIAILTES